jgi:hypothetical protein
VLSMKSLTALLVIITLGLTLRYMGLLPINNLLINYSGYNVPYSNLGTRSIDDATIKKLRQETSTITKEIIIQSVGEEYFLEHFSEPRVEVRDRTDGDWFANAYYTYNYSVGNETFHWYVGAWYNEAGQVIYTEGIPHQGNLMPFKVTKESAEAIARYVLRFQGFPGGYTGVNTGLVYVGNYGLVPRVDGYAWVVSFWKIFYGYASWGGASGESIQVIIDPNSAWVYATVTSRFNVVS